MRSRIIYPAILAASLAVATVPLTAAELSGTVIAAGSNDTYNLPLLGALDWALWNTGANPAPGTPTVSMAGAGLIGDMAPYNGGNLRGSTAPTQPTANFIHTDGAVATNITGIFNTTLNTTRPTTNCSSVPSRPGRVGDSSNSAPSPIARPIPTTTAASPPTSSA